ncbi:MAG TPA: methyltransferase domain-containing protein [Blastocatellia bacterium]|nr:methyltransferase domain-containing protein [Blastocatellia bacterium]
MSQSADDLLKAWNEAAQHWETYREEMAFIFAPITGAMIDEAGLQPGMTVLDVAGGVGEPGLTIASTVAPSGSVLCTDAAPEMVAAAQREANRRGLTNIAFKQCPADNLPFPADSFDVVVCRLGAFFFPDPIRAFREMLRVTRSGGKIVLAVWKGKENNPYFSAVSDVVDRYVTAQANDPDAPGPFRFSDPGLMATLLARAGAERVRERVFEFRLVASMTVGRFWEMRSETSDSLRSRLATLPAEDRKRLDSEMTDALKRYFSGTEMNMPGAVWIVSGLKQGRI